MLVQLGGRQGLPILPVVGEWFCMIIIRDGVRMFLTLTEVLEGLGLAEKGWLAGEWGDTLVCPHGWEIDLDVSAPDGCANPIVNWNGCC